jgi:hypothetical protein
MTKPTRELTLEEMKETLYGRAEEIFLLCCIVTRRGLAHAFCDLSAHVQTLTCRVVPIDTDYQQGHMHLVRAELIADLAMDDFFSHQFQIENFQRQMSEIDTYVSYLDFIIARNEPLTMNEQEQAA